MSKIKKIIFSLMMAILTIVGFHTIINAYSVGQKDPVVITYDEYQNSGSIFCVEHWQALTTYNYYNVISQVTIEGNRSTDHEGNTIESWHNAKLAYILSADNGSYKRGGPVANAIWNYMYTWLTNVGQYHAGLYQGFSNGVHGSPTWLDTASDNYANNLGDTIQVKDNTNRDNIKVSAYERDGEAYMRVGPFNWSFPGQMVNVTAEDQNGNQISNLKFSSFNGSNEYWYGANNIESGKEFYLSVPMDLNLTKITRITGQASATVKGVNIWFLESTEGYKQNLIVREPYEVPVDLTTPFDYDITTQGNLKIIKVNKDNKEFVLPGVGFIIQHKETGKYLDQAPDGTISYVDEKDAMEFITNVKGEIPLEGLIVGTYVAYETKNPNYGYEFLAEGQEKPIVADETTVFIIENTQIYVKLSGYVWVDQVDGKRTERNDLFKTTTKTPIGEDQPDGKDILFNGVIVRLKDRTTGETLQETVTSKLDRYKDSVNNGNGEYLFMDVLIEKLKDYYIEFQYDGLTYTNVVPHIEQDRGSKSAESEEERDTFNKNFSKVEGKTRNTGFTKDANDKEKHALSYNLNEAEHEATLINNGQYTITANTDVPNYRIRNHFTYGQEEVQYINLGLYEREQPDLAIEKDLNNVRVAVNGYEHTYLYSQRFLNEGEYGSGFNVGVKFGSKYSNVSYTRAIYKADYEYRNEKENSKELKVYVTYEIKLRNESSNLTAKVNSMVEYFDQKYETIKAGTKLDGTKKIIEDIASPQVSNYNNNYKKAIINTNTTLGAGKETSIYVEFALSREAVINILNDKATLNSVSEINSYSIFNGNKIYAGIDRDSAPGNCIPGDTRTYEDDTDSSPALKLEVADAREIAGKVFLDETTGELMTGKIRQGSGAYEENEKGIKGVAITFQENTGSEKVYHATTNDNGDFFISGYIPGDYTLTYTWGDKTYTVQDYKATIYNKDRDQNNKKWYKENVDTRLSDAMDNYTTRQAIDEEIKRVTNGTESKITKTIMDSTTPTMGIGVEYESAYTASYGDRYTYRINNVDFGIVERARQDLKLTKRIKTLKATLANGQAIADLEIDENGNVTGNKQHVTYMKPSPNITPSNGFIRLELDNELIQGTILEVGYEIKAINQSELDFLSPNYYHYGIQEGQKITIEPTGIIDYLDKNWSFDSKKNPQWQVKTLEEIKNLELIAETVYNNEESKIEEKTILYTEGLKGTKLEPEQTAEIMLNVSKILTTAEDISLDNETEVAELNRPGGSKPESTPGSYVPGTTPIETDEAKAETTIVIPATGENQNYILPVIIGVTAFIIIGAGVIIIKKKVM